MQLRDAEQLRPQPEVTVERRQIGVGLGDERVEDGDRYVVVVEHTRDRVRILAHLAVHGVLLQLRIEVDPERALVGLVGGEERVHHPLALITVGTRPVLGIGRVVEGHILGPDPQLRPGNIGVGENRIRRGTCVIHQAEARDQRLALVTERVRCPAEDAIEGESIDGEPAIFAQELRDALLTEVQDFRIDERPGFLELVAQDIGALVELEGGRRARVFRELLSRKQAKPIVALGQVRLQVEALPEARGAVAEMPFARCKFGELRFELHRVRVPGRERWINFRQVPAVGRGFGQRSGGPRRDDDQPGETDEHVRLAESLRRGRDSTRPPGRRGQGILASGSQCKMRSWPHKDSCPG